MLKEVWALHRGVYGVFLFIYLQPRGKILYQQPPSGGAQHVLMLMVEAGLPRGNPP